ncbi:hypothetical protein D030_5437B, partial [Vibrio parahaemolyticus AQ3810]
MAVECQWYITRGFDACD